MHSIKKTKNGDKVSIIFSKGRSNVHSNIKTDIKKIMENNMKKATRHMSDKK